MKEYKLIIKIFIILKRLPNMNVTQIFCDADDFYQRFIPDWEQRQLEPDEINENKSQGAFSLWEWNHYAGGLLSPFWLSTFNGSIRDWFKSTGWQTFLVCQATTVLLNWCPMSWCDCRVYAESLWYGERHCVYRFDIFVRLQKYPYSTSPYFQGCGWARQVVNGLVLWL